MSNDFFNASGTPPQGGGITSPNMRAEFAAVAAGFDKLPTLTGNGYKVTYINSSGTAIDVIGGSGLLVLSASGIPTVLTPGTGVATALAVNVGSAGAPVLFNGAGGTPSSMVGTNITGTAAGLTAGAVAVGGITGLGTGVATALAVNVGSAGAPVLFNGAGGTPSSLVLTNATGLPLASVAGLILNDFRLTLTSGLPVTTADVTGATTIYCTPKIGNRIALYDGSAWNVRQSAQFSLALGTLTSGKPYDVFCYDNAGTPTLEFLVWTNDTTRATALAYQDGVLVKSGAATRRYLGTFYTTATNTTEDSAANRYLWNYYHRAPRKIKVIEGTNSWTYTTAAFRQANNSVANQVNLVVGVDEDAVSLSLVATATNATSGVALISTIGLDSTTAKASDALNALVYTNGTGSLQMPMTAQFCGNVGLGRHYLAWLEFSAASGTTTWYGDNGATTVQSGLVGVACS